MTNFDSPSASTLTGRNLLLVAYADHRSDSQSVCPPVLSDNGRLQASTAYEWREKLGIRPSLVVLDGTDAAKKTAFPHGCPKTLGHPVHYLSTLLTSGRLAEIISGLDPGANLYEARRKYPELPSFLWEWKQLAMREIARTFASTHVGKEVMIMIVTQRVVQSLLAGESVQVPREGKTIPDYPCRSDASTVWIRNGRLMGLLQQDGLLPYEDRPSMIPAAPHNFAHIAERAATSATA